MTPDTEHLIWVLQGARAGDNAQARELASQLGWQAMIKPLFFNILHRLPNALLGARIASVRRRAAAGLVPPWPDLVIATGKRTAPVARWIKKQSGGRTKIVQLGRPRAPLAAFDLVVTTPQYGLPSAANVVEVFLPFATPQPVEAAALTRWSAAWSHLPRPWIALVIGAPRKPLRLGDAEIARLTEATNRLAAASGGSLMVVGSPRTPQGAAEQIGAGLTAPAILYPWNTAENPYQAVLALADRFVVTSDSASMLGETIRTGKPVDIFILPSSRRRLGWQTSARLAAWLSRRGILQPRGDMLRLVNEIIGRGHARPLGSDLAIQPLTGGVGDDIVVRIKAMFDAP